jgi:hypothetical protein
METLTEQLNQSQVGAWLELAFLDREERRLLLGASLLLLTCRLKSCQSISKKDVARLELLADDAI